LRLQQFRNYTSLEAEFTPGLNLIVGANGQGKTNLLESVCYLALLRSFRSRQINSLRQWGADSFSVFGRIDHPGGGAINLAVTYGERRQLRAGGQPVEKASEFINRFLCVPFVPEDIELAKGAAGVRRRFLDIVLSQTEPLYLHHLQRYTAALRSRNIVLREPAKYASSSLSAYDTLLVRHGGAIVASRRSFATELDASLESISRDLLGGVRLSVKLSCNVLGSTGADVLDPNALEGAFEEALGRSLERDRDEGCTRCGPHRDDLILSLDGRALGLFGSEGQCRLASLALRLASLAGIRRTSGNGRAVILLVDDVVGELDARGRGAFFDAFQQGDQTFVAATSAPPELSGRIAGSYRVESGRLAPNRDPQ